MIERIVAFALHQRFVVLALALILTVGGLVSYGHLPIEAYPDVGDVKVEIITLWPGHAAEEVERLITIPLENELNGIANVTFLRSDTLFGLSNIRVLFADGTDDYWARQQVQERLAGAELPSDAKPQLGPLSGVIGEIFRYTLESKTLPLYEVKAIQDWVLEREFKKVPGVADVVSWGGGTKQYQVVVDPGRLRAYNLTLKQVFDAVATTTPTREAATSRRGTTASRCGASASCSRWPTSRASWWRPRRARRCGCATSGRWPSAPRSAWACSGATTTTTWCRASC